MIERVEEAAAEMQAPTIEDVPETEAETPVECSEEVFHCPRYAGSIKSSQSLSER